MPENKTTPTEASAAGNDVGAEQLLKLGKHKMGNACLYFKQLADLDKAVLKQLVVNSVAETKRRYP